jgi:predicted dehydrogenase
MGSKVRVGVIGTGQIGKYHVRRYSEMADVELVALCDIRKDEVERVAQQYKVPHTYGDYKELLKRDDLDAVDICLHNWLHSRVTIDVLESGRHAYCEKPMSWTYPQAKAMYEAAQRTGKMLHIQLGTLYKPETRAAKRLLDAGTLGKLYYVKSHTYRRRGRPFVDGYGTAEFVSTKTAGGGTLLDMGIYSLGRMMYLLDCPEVLTVSGASYQETGMYEDRRKSSGYNVEELGIALVRLAGGMTLSIESSWAIHSGPPEGDCLMGNQGGVRLEPFTYFSTLADMEMDSTFDLQSAEVRWHQIDPCAEGYDDSQKHWVWALLGRVPLLETARYALRASQITEGVYLSASRGCEVSVDEINLAPAGAGR